MSAKNWAKTDSRLKCFPNLNLERMEIAFKSKNQMLTITKKLSITQKSLRNLIKLIFTDDYLRNICNHEFGAVRKKFEIIS